MTYDIDRELKVNTNLFKNIINPTFHTIDSLLAVGSNTPAVHHMHSTLQQNVERQHINTPK